MRDTTRLYAKTHTPDSDAFDAFRDEPANATTVDCPICGASAGERCANPGAWSSPIHPARAVATW